MSDAPPTGGARARLDVAMVARGIAPTRAQAQGLILSGRVLVGGAVVDKCGAPVRAQQEISIAPGTRRFASRGGEKLSGALDDLRISVRGTIALDVGASTGGFTDCLLQRGARTVHAVDVGRGLLDDRLRNDPRVVVLDGVNFRHAAAGLLSEKVDLATVDVSFISLRLILPALRQFLAPGARVLALVKPQFEAGRESVGKGGVVRDEAARRKAVERIADFAAKAGFAVEGQVESRVPGPRGNREVFLHLLWKGEPERP